MSESGKLPFSLFTTSHLRPRDQFEAWHDECGDHWVEPAFDRILYGPDS